LDQGTSGLVVVAKTDAAHRRLSRAFAEREVRKSYRALVWGRPEPAGGVIERPIGRSRGNPTKMAIHGVRGRSRPALTLFRTAETMPGFALLDIDLRTGRTHQIRVHLQSIHHPIVGDERYGGRAWRGVQDPIKRKALRELERLALHAAVLEFPHPCGNRLARFEAPLPDDLVHLLDILRAAT
jgi:23S rRNA pseudouridine1911/1915/1917 synthase